MRYAGSHKDKFTRNFSIYYGLKKEKHLKTSKLQYTL